MGRSAQGGSILISVITPTFNRISTLKRAVDSVLDQTYRDWELIIIDDGSTDETWSYLNSLEHPQIVIEQTQNRGVSAARNLAVSMSKGEWLSFLDSDDYWLPQKLQKQASFINENSNYQIVHTDEVWIRNGVRVNPMKKHAKSGGDLFEKCLPLCCISPSCVTLKRDLFLREGGFREDFPVCEDYDLWLKICAGHAVGYIEEKLVVKTGGHADQLSRKFHSMDYYRVRALDYVLSHKPLSQKQKSAAIQVLQRKCEVLLRGYQKHGNLKNESEVKSLQFRYHQNGILT